MKNAIKFFGIAALVLTMLFALTACDDGNNNNDNGTWGNPPAALVGTWLMMGTSPVMVINANGTGTVGGDPVNSWKVKGNELKMDYSGVESIVKWSISGNQLTLTYPNDTSTLGLGSMLIAYSPLTKQGGNDPNNPGGSDKPAVEMLNLEYDGNGYYGELPETSHYNHGFIAKVSTFIPVMEGYTFTGWNTEPDGGGTAYAAEAKFAITRNTTLYAQWREDSGNGGDPSKPVLTGTVSIDGTAQVGQTLTANITELEGSGTIFYRWKRDWEVTIGTNSSTYIVQPADVGGLITVTVTRSGNSDSVTSNSTSWVLDLPALTGSVSIDGAAEVGQTLTANTDLLGGSGTITYQWKRGGATVGTNSNIYQLTTADKDSTITVTVTRSGNSSSASASVTVLKPAVPVPGSTLAAQLVWLANVAESYGSYILEASADETVPATTLSYASNISITLKGTGGVRTIKTMFTVGSTVTLVLDNNITLQGQCRINSGGKLVMNTGAAIANTYNGVSLDSTGGVVYVMNNGIFSMNGGTISGNTASSTCSKSAPNNSQWDSSAGVIYVASGGTFSMSGGTISGNTVSSNSTNPNPTSQANAGGRTTSYAGVIYVANGGTFNMSGGTISDNNVKCSVSGGVLYLPYPIGGYVYSRAESYCGVIYIAGYNGTFSMYGGEISNNPSPVIESNLIADYSSATGGVFNSGNFTMSGGKISGNTAINGGGVLGNVHMTGGEISDNTATSAGGGVSGGVTMSGNAVIRANKAASGGGVSGNVNMNGGTISDNTATNYGGGVSGSLTMNGGTISGNTATNGGGVVATGYGGITMYNGTISGNTATNGGGVYVLSSTFTMEGGTISGNTASDSGGGVYVLANSSLTKTGGTISGYSGSNKGNAVYVDYSVLAIHKETTAGPEVNLSWDGTTNPPRFSGGWEY
jgi:uncharacterized repeat protein (TIGR02543 family)